MGTTIAQPVQKTRLAGWWTFLRASWYWEGVIIPFVITRLAWILAAAFARATLEPNPTYLRYAKQGGIHTKIFLLDIFAHWDAGFFLTLIKDGYWNISDFANQYSNTAFFPLYPYLVKSIGWLGVNVPVAGYLFIGILFSNACFLVGLWLLHRLATRHMGLSEEGTGRGIMLLFVFPAAFIFSSFYSESLFFVLSLAVFVLALEKRWGWAGIAAALTVLTRTQGILVYGALVWLYLSSRGWRLREIRWDAGWLALAPAALLVHIYSLYRITGSPLAFVAAQVAWGRNKYGLFEGLWMQINAPALDVYKLDAFWMLLFLACGIYMLWKWQNKVYGLYTLLAVIMPVSTGVFISGTRYMIVVFPAFLLLGEKIKNPDAFRLVQALCFTLQILYFAAWANYYWVA